jgi:hypothetical protein
MKDADMKRILNRLADHVSSHRNLVVREDYINVNGKTLKLITLDQGVDLGVNELGLMERLECVSYLLDNEKREKTELARYKTRAEAIRGHEELVENLSDVEPPSSLKHLDINDLVRKISDILPDDTDFFIIIDRKKKKDLHSSEHEVLSTGHIEKRVLIQTLKELLVQFDD